MKLKKYKKEDLNKPYKQLKIVMKENEELDIRQNMKTCI